MTNSHTIAQSDPYAPFPTYDAFGKGKGKGHPVTPESSAHGFFLVAIALIFVLLARFENRRK